MSELIPGHEYKSRAEEMWALVIESLAGWEERAGAAAADAGLSPVSAWALVQLEPGAPISQKELAARMKCNPSTVVDPTDRLEEAGFVIRRPNPDDRRVNVLSVTPKGVRVRKKLIARLLEPPAAFRRLPSADQARFRDVMIESLRGTAESARASSRGTCRRRSGRPSDSRSRTTSGAGLTSRESTFRG